MRDVVIHMGHCFRTRGATGTSGHRGTEQQFVSQVAARMADQLSPFGVNAVTALADDPLPRAKIFVALHQDGSVNPQAQGASVGYPVTTPNYQFAQLWKANYTLKGWPNGFRPDNYTRGLRNYYGFRRINADVKVLMEHGFATNRADENWMWDNMSLVVQAHVETITQWLGVKRPPSPPTDQEEDEMPHIWEDAETKQTWVCQGNKARVAADGNGNPTGRAMKGANPNMELYSYPFARSIVADLYNVV